MGWTYFQKPENVKQWFEDHLTWESETKLYCCLKSAIKFKVAYAAVETIDKKTGTREVWAAVYLLNYTRSNDYNFGYKDQDESLGPFDRKCPASILELLTAPCNENAAQWRQRCWENLAKKKSNNQRKIELGQRYKLINCRIPEVNITGKRRTSYIGEYAGNLYRIKTDLIGELAA
jgi:hypothetical protein